MLLAFTDITYFATTAPRVSSGFMSQRKDNGASLSKTGEKIFGLGANSAHVTIDHDGLGYGHNASVTSIVKSIVKVDDPDQ